MYTCNLHLWSRYFQVVSRKTRSIQAWNFIPAATCTRVHVSSTCAKHAVQSPYTSTNHSPRYQITVHAFREAPSHSSVPPSCHRRRHFAWIRVETVTLSSASWSSRIESRRSQRHRCDMTDDGVPQPPPAPGIPYVPASVIPSGVMTDANGQNLRPGRSFIWPPIDPNQQPPTWIKVINQGTESCIFKSATSAVVGGGLGLMCGLFFGGYSNAVDKAVEMDGTAGMKLRVGMKEAAKSMSSYAKSFAKVGGIYVLAECSLERVRARHDLFNSVVGGCITGGALSASPKSVMPPRARAMQMAMGCASFAVFSAAIEYYMEYM